eukprot:scaffold71_cov247-Pinguiococcus_pyrenoidosus.AAC.7
MESWRVTALQPPLIGPLAREIRIPEPFLLAFRRFHFITPPQLPCFGVCHIGLSTFAGNLAIIFRPPDFPALLVSFRAQTSTGMSAPIAVKINLVSATAHLGCPVDPRVCTQLKCADFDPEGVGKPVVFRFKRPRVRVHVFRSGKFMIHSSAGSLCALRWGAQKLVRTLNRVGVAAEASKWLHAEKIPKTSETFGVEYPVVSLTAFCKWCLVHMWTRECRAHG